MWWFKKKKKLTREEVCAFLVENHYKYAAPFEAIEMVCPYTTRGSYIIIVKQMPLKEAEEFYESVYHNKG